MNQKRKSIHPAHFIPKALIAVLMSALFVFSVPAWAGGPEGEYIKDSRDLDEIGLICELSVWKTDGGKYEITLNYRSPGLCGGAERWTVPIKNGLAAVRDENYELDLTFKPGRIAVTGKSGGSEQCPVTGGYVLYGTLPGSIEDAITRIRRHYKYINENLNNFDKVELELAGFSTEGGQLTGWSYMGNPKKAVAEHYGEMGKVLEEYYFFDSDLLFSLRIRSNYDQPHGNVVSKVVERFYFHQGKLIRYLDNDKKEVSRDDKRYAMEQERVMLLATRFGGAVVDNEGKTVLDRSEGEDL